MIKKKQKILFLFLVCFSIYNALTIGQSWDEGFLINQGKITLDYLLSLGKVDVDIYLREYYSPIYYSLKYLEGVHLSVGIRNILNLLIQKLIT